MSLEQGVILVPSRHEHWSALATKMITKLDSLVPDAAIEHFGSTSVPGLQAKDIVDLLVGVEKSRILDVSHRLRSAGFDLEGEYAHHSWLSYPTRAERIFIVHVVEFEGVAWRRRIAFRDLLRGDEAAREKYLRAKIASRQSTDNLDDYTQSKTSIVRELLEGIGH